MAEVKDIVYCSWDGEPAVIAHYDDATTPSAAYAYKDDEWARANCAEVSNSAAVLSRGNFEKSFPDIGLPEELLPVG